MTDFALHPQLEEDTFFITHLPLCAVRLMNNSLFPWLILVPRVLHAKEIIDLPDIKRHALMDEIAFASEVLKALFDPHKINIAALGNQVSQLHVHVIARFTEDAAWPNPVWGKGSKSYDDPKPMIEKIQRYITRRSVSDD